MSIPTLRQGAFASRPGHGAIDWREHRGSLSRRGVPVVVGGVTACGWVQVAGAIFRVDILRTTDGEVEGEARGATESAGGRLVLVLAPIAVDDRPLPGFRVERPGEHRLGSGRSGWSNLAHWSSRPGTRAGRPS